MIEAPIRHIRLDPAGIAYIGGTRMKVADVAVDAEVWGLTPAQILDNYPRLSLSQIHAALAYYYDHRREIDAYIAAGTQEYERIRSANPNPLSRQEFVNRLQSPRESTAGE